MKVFNPEKQKLTDFRYAHVKRDGHFISVQKNDIGIVRVYSKNWNPVDLTWHPIWTNLILRLQYCTHLYCELWRPGKPASYISSGLANKDKDLVLECFAAPSLGHGTQAKAYSLSLAHLNVECRRWGIPFVPFYDRLREPLSMGLGPLGREKLDGCILHEDSEGYVLKNSNLSEPYKWKPFRDADLVVTGVSPGKKGKYEGQLGALICSLAGGEEVANVSGMSDADRKLMTTMHEQGRLLGRIVEVKYQYVNSQGRLRHASFVRFRNPNDKAIADAYLS